MAFNITPSGLSTFILNGIPGLEDAHIWISIPFSMFCVVTLLGNSMILFVVSKEQTLHKPMYLLICMLALTDIGQTTCVMPKALCIFWFGFKDITGNGCLTQMFFLHTFHGMYGTILVTMAFDRYIAICDPLRYATILTNVEIAKLGLVGLIRGIFLVLPLVLLLKSHSFCNNNFIPHTYCDNLDVVKMSCGDTRVNQTYNLVAITVFIGIDLTLIGLCYGLIIRADLRISSKRAHQKTLNTCTVHICVILMTYIPFLFSGLTHMFGHGVAAHVHILLANLYLLVPPCSTPLYMESKQKSFMKNRDNIFAECDLPGLLTFNQHGKRRKEYLLIICS